jgi:hypothetical protein
MGVPSSSSSWGRCHRRGNRTRTRRSSTSSSPNRNSKRPREEHDHGHHHGTSRSGSGRKSSVPTTTSSTTNSISSTSSTSSTHLQQLVLARSGKGASVPALVLATRRQQEAGGANKRSKSNKVVPSPAFSVRQHESPVKKESNSSSSNSANSPKLGLNNKKERRAVGVAACPMAVNMEGASLTKRQNLMVSRVLEVAQRLEVMKGLPFIPRVMLGNGELFMGDTNPRSATLVVFVSPNIDLQAEVNLPKLLRDAMVENERCYAERVEEIKSQWFSSYPNPQALESSMQRDIAWGEGTLCGDHSSMCGQESLSESCVVNHTYCKWLMGYYHEPAFKALKEHGEALGSVAEGVRWAADRAWSLSPDSRRMDLAEVAQCWAESLTWRAAHRSVDYEKIFSDMLTKGLPGIRIVLVNIELAKEDIGESMEAVGHLVWSPASPRAIRNISPLFHDGPAHSAAVRAVSRFFCQSEALGLAVSVLRTALQSILAQPSVLAACDGETTSAGSSFGNWLAENYIRVKHPLSSGHYSLGGDEASVRAIVGCMLRSHVLVQGGGKASADVAAHAERLSSRITIRLEGGGGTRESLSARLKQLKADVTSLSVELDTLAIFISHLRLLCCSRWLPQEVRGFMRAVADENFLPGHLTSRNYGIISSHEQGSHIHKAFAAFPVCGLAITTQRCEGLIRVPVELPVLESTAAERWSSPNGSMRELPADEARIVNESLLSLLAMRATKRRHASRRQIEVALSREGLPAEEEASLYLSCPSHCVRDRRWLARSGALLARYNGDGEGKSTFKLHALSQELFQRIVKFL